MKQLVVGVLAHVDAGKTTLSEGMLYQSGSIRRLGRVDHRDAFLDTYELERERGITIFSKQAVFRTGELEIILLDTPGHVDFSSEMERTLQVLDYAILVISGTDGVQVHTRTLWRLLAQHGIPVFLFVNKMDLPGPGREALLAELRSQLSEGCMDFSAGEDDVFFENAAMCDEDVLNRYLETGCVTDDDIRTLIRRRQLFPCYFGSALKLEGVDALLAGINRYTAAPHYRSEFGAKVYKIARDAQGRRLTYLKVTGGVLRVKDVLRGTGTDGAPWEEKADQLRLYSGARFQSLDEAPAGMVCAVTGLTKTYPGEGLGAETTSVPPVLEPVLTYQVLLPEGYDPHTAFLQLRQLEEEDPQLHIVWNERLREIHVKLMGEVQLEILRHMIQERFGLSVDFGAGSIVYRETIAAPVEGVGHFEPLRHYAEVHLLLEPDAPGRGLTFDTACPEDALDRSWQRLILTHLGEREHLGVLTGSPITDMRITLIAGRAHLKHTEGGDFRQATYRAVRQGLMRAQSVLLEPYYDFRLELPPKSLGRAMNDIGNMSGSFAPPETIGDAVVLTGSAPVSEMHGYAAQVTSYTKGRGKLSFTVKGYAPCHNAAEVIASIGYDPSHDLDNPADSVFCAHGAGFTVRWDHVEAYMHIDTGLRLGADQSDSAPVGETAPHRTGPLRYSGTLREDQELAAIFERTYGPVKDGHFFDPKPIVRERLEEHFRLLELGTDYLLVDGYNIIFAWDDLKKLAAVNMDAARHTLMDILSNYQGFKKCVLILVFDAYKVQRNVCDVERYHNIYVVYTKEAETADMYIERTTYELSRNRRVRVATSDGMEQLIILGHGAMRISARAFREEVEQAKIQIAEIIRKINRT